jgi:hypothetical protein
VHVVVAAAGLILIAAVLWDAFETVVLPRTVTRRFRLARGYFRVTWRTWTALSRSFEGAARHERFLAIFGPMSLIGLLGVWAIAQVVGFAALQWGVRTHLDGGPNLSRVADFLYMSGTSFFTLGLSDVHPTDPLGRFLTVLEGGLGFGFLGVVIAYFPVLYQSFSRREVRLTLLDAWAGSPPAAAEVVRRLAEAGEIETLERFLRDWEVWCSELLESHISYPVVAYFRSQHQKQSWTSALTSILDLTALIAVGIEGIPTWQARATFAIARHAAVDLSQVFQASPDYHCDRLDAAALEQLRRQLETVGLKPRRSPDADARLLELRQSYEPYVGGLARYLQMPLPDWMRTQPAKDNWETSPRRADGHL